MASATVKSVTLALEEVSLEEVLNRHRRERKELQAKIQEIKKNAPKSDKKKRKDAMEEVSRIEHELEHRQAMEVKAVRAQEECVIQPGTTDVAPTELIPSEAVENDNEEKNGVGDAPQRVSKAQKRRDKKAHEARQREEDIRAAAEDAQYAPKAIEAGKMLTKLKERQLAEHQIHSDGDCLYNAIRHQLLQHGLGAYSVQQLRTETANYIRANKESCICFMTHPRTGEMLSDSEFEEYCESVRSTPAWGGQIELKALSSILKVPIEVLQAEGALTVQGADEFAGPNLVITYHRHLYSLGEHYNSTIPLSEVRHDAAAETEL